MIKEELSAAYINKILRDHKEYLGCDERRRKQLITCDLYDVEQAYEDGWDAFRNVLLYNATLWIKEHINESIINESTEEELNVIIGAELWKILKKAMEEE